MGRGTNELTPNPDSEVSVRLHRLAAVMVVCLFALLLLGCGQDSADGTSSDGFGATGFGDDVSMPVSMPGAPDSRMGLFSSDAIVDQVWPTVVRINTDVMSGSGVIAQTQGSTGYVVTNHHVIDGATRIQVTVGDRDTYEGQMLGSDAVRDLAVVMICCGNFQKATFADVADLKPTTEVVLIGYPLGIPGTATATKGIVSAVRYDSRYQAEVIQTDAAINPGNSGGAMVSLNGEVLGINTFKITDAEGLGFAVSSDVVLAQLPSLSGSAAVVPALPTAVSLLTPTPTAVPAALPTSDDSALEARIERLERELRQTPSPAVATSPFVGTPLPGTPNVAPAPKPTPTPHPCSVVTLESVEEMEVIYTRFLAADPYYQSVANEARGLLERQFMKVGSAYVVQAVANPLGYPSFRDYLGLRGYVVERGEIAEGVRMLQRRGLLPDSEETLADYSDRKADDPCTLARSNLYRDDGLMTLLAVAYANDTCHPALCGAARRGVINRINAFRDGDVATPLIFWFLDYYGIG